MNYSNMTVGSAVISYLEDHAPAKPRDIAAATKKEVRQVYTELGKLKKAGKVKNLKAEGWTVVHRAPKSKLKAYTKPEQNTVGQYSKAEVAELERQLGLAHSAYGNLLSDMRKTQDKYNELLAVAKYLEKRNGQLLARIWEIENEEVQQGE